MANRTRRTGVVELELWRHVSSSLQYEGIISNAQVIDFLLHYKLMTEVDCGEEMKGWFMPCLLLPNSYVDTITTDFLENCSICPLLIGFTENTVPFGQFTSLLVQL